ELLAINIRDPERGFLKSQNAYWSIFLQGMKAFEVFSPLGPVRLGICLTCPTGPDFKAVEEPQSQVLERLLTGSGVETLKMQPAR
ncbi:UNVERIFIED_CONTAM: hypothetical protein K2H54_063349, partial [Gekko kuhli]